jgi:hypothetical protein
LVRQREADLADLRRQRDADRAETGVADIREVAAEEPEQAERDEVRVPSAEETADTIAQAQRALREIEQRQAIEASQAAEEARAVELSRRHVEDVAEQASADETAEVFAR